MNITLLKFITLFSEFKKVLPATVEAYIAVATIRVPQTVWGANTEYATALLTAHMLATQGPQGGGPAGGALTQEQVGDLSRSFGAVGEQSSGDAELRTTRYGIDFIALRRETIVTAMPARSRIPRCW